MSPAALSRLVFNPTVNDLDPLIVTSPTPRSGTTLLQRLLCSSPDALIYGEKCAQDLEMSLNIFVMKAQEYRFHQHGLQRNLDNVLQGQVNDWIYDLMPDVDGYLAALESAAFAGITYCRDFAARLERRAWGFKYPGWNAGTVNLLKSAMPKARFLFITRDLVPCLKSAKAQQMVISLSDTREFCRQWANGVGNQPEGDGSTLTVKYEALVREPESILPQIETFAGVRAMDRAILKEKINVPTRMNFETQTADGYIPPDELNEAEWLIVNETLASVGQPVIAG